MAEVAITGQVSPYVLRGTFNFTDAELSAAFSVADPDEQLFFDVYGPELAHKLPSEKFEVLKRMAELVERAATLGLTAGSPEPK